MKLATKFILGYLAVSSAILHVVLIGIAVWMFPAMREVWNVVNEMKRAEQGKAANKAVVKAVSELKNGEYTYTGYALEYQGQILYAPGVLERFKVGDQVALTIQKHPSASLKSIFVMVTKDGK